MTAPNRYGVAWDATLFPNYCRESDELQATIRAAAFDAPDDADVFMAAHVALVLSRTACDRESFRLLEAFHTPGLQGYTTYELARAGMDWSFRRNVNKAHAIGTLRRLAAAIEAEMPGEIDVETELADAKAEMGCVGADLSLLDWLPRRSAATRAWDAAVRSWRRKFVWRGTEPLVTPEKIRKARGQIAKAVRP